MPYGWRSCVLGARPPDQPGKGWVPTCTLPFASAPPLGALHFSRKVFTLTERGGIRNSGDTPSVVWGQLSTYRKGKHK